MGPNGLFIATVQFFALSIMYFPKRLFIQCNVGALRGCYRSRDRGNPPGFLLISHSLLSEVLSPA